MQITSSIHMIPGISAHPYLLVDNDGLTLIDTGLPGNHHRILHYIRKSGYSIKDLRRILLTHADCDHAGSAAALKRITGARLYASESEARALEKGMIPRPLKTDNPLVKPFFRLAEWLGRIPPAHVDCHLQKGQALPILGGLQVVDSSGHTPGHLSFFSPQQGVLFTGDSIVYEKNSLVGSHAPVTWDQKLADQSVLRQIKLKVRLLCVGHGAITVVGVGMLWKLAESVINSQMIHNL